MGDDRIPDDKKITAEEFAVLIAPVWRAFRARFADEDTALVAFRRELKRFGVTMTEVPRRPS
jgi:hypothetical protein